ncbi:hypothetical protein HU200_055859 [Digitaria exilis]|uniref:Uncharacterized protein n=1 Tax=Digitaria exilis TaxID=1010633 RepID=A0A835AH20_9POAL|nr:hypothetical protein HU200_055859 [Digitaria exilis]
MAAIRSALTMLGRRSCSSSGSMAAASLGGTGLEKVFRPAARRTPPLPSLRQAGHSLEVRKHQIISLSQVPISLRRSTKV